MRAALLCAILSSLGIAAPRENLPWTLAATPHFDIYSNSDAASARALAVSFERLRSFFLSQVDLAPAAQRELRIICFATDEEYQQYRLRAGTGGYYIGAESRDYIVLPALPNGEMRSAAHEYAHVLIHSGAWKLPDWLTEGLGDVISTLQIRERETRIGGDLPGRSQLLKSSVWMPLAELFDFSLKSEAAAGREPLFYAQSWALTDLLMLSPSYSAGFPALLAALASGVAPVQALDTIYRTSPEALLADMRARVARHPGWLPLPAVSSAAPEVRVATLSPFDARVMLADLRLAGGDVAAAATAFRELAAERRDSPEVHAGLGAVALKQGNAGEAVNEWKRALELGIADADLCFRYATLADERGLPAREALLRALALRPEFDDARYKLALVEKNAGHVAEAVAQLRAMHHVGEKRAFAYWLTMADAYLELDRRAEAKEAAGKARQHAASLAERDRALEIAWLADTELAVEIDGEKFRTVRVPVGAASRNPFIESGDRARSVDATLRQVDCGDGGIKLTVDTAQGALTLSVADPARVQIRNAGSEAFEFVCGPQEARKVLVEYAPAQSLLRGLEFK